MTTNTASRLRTPARLNAGQGDPTYSRILVVGIGSAHGDDQAGWLILDQLERRLAGQSHSIVLRKLSAPIDLIQELNVVDELFVCDAIDSVANPGQLTRWLWPTSDLVRTRSASSHQLGLPEVLELADTLNRLPAHVEIWGISGSGFRPGSEPSASVRVSCERLAELWMEELARA